MNGEPDNYQCPECGGSVGQDTSYCMHCYADLSDSDSGTVETTIEGVADSDAEWEAATSDSTDRTEQQPHSSGSSSKTLTQTGDITKTDQQISSPDTNGILNDDGLVDNSLTVIVGLVGGLIVGFVGTIVLGVATSSAWAVPAGIVGWLLATAYLVRRKTVQVAVAHSGYAVAAVFLTIPLLALSPAVSVSGGISGRVDTFAGLLFGSIILGIIPASIGWVASYFVSSNH